MKIIVAGFKGRMGSTAMKMVLETEDFELSAVFDPEAKEKNISELSSFSEYNVPVFQNKEEMVNAVEADVWIDFTVPSSAYENTHFALEHRIRPVVGTTGLTEKQVDELKKLAENKKVGGLIAPNFAIGAVLMMQFAEKAAKYFRDVEIIEMHHDQKLDAPSGTAIKTADMIYDERGKHQQGNPNEKETLEGARGADYKGIKIHSVRLPGLIAHQQVQFGGTGEGLTIRHDSYERSSFMTGVALGCREVMQETTLIHGLENIL